jgi:hypothetical protein
MTFEKLEEIMAVDVSIAEELERCEGKHYIITGLNILMKYQPEICIDADHDTLLAGDVNIVLEAGLTEEDAAMLRDLGWFVNNYGRFQVLV